MTMNDLTNGALGKLLNGEIVENPQVQVLGYKPIASAGQERYRLLLSDGFYCNCFCMLATQFNNFIREKKLEPFTIIRIKNNLLNKGGGEKKILFIMDLDVLIPGSEIKVKLGNPVQIGSDGVVPPLLDQNKDPNAGSTAKRPVAGKSASEPPAKVAATPRSILQSRPGAGLSTASSVSSSGCPVTPISAITPYQNKWTIKARVTSKSDIRTWNKASGSGKLFSMDLMDDSGEIRATAFKEQCDMYYEMIQVGKVYYISRCTVKAANKAFSKLNNDYELTFKDNVMVELADESAASDVPTMVYNFVKIANLANAVKDTTVDVIGVCKVCNDPVTINTRAGKELLKREISLVDDSNTEVTVTLWGGTASSFVGDGNPVVAAKGARVSDFNGVTLSASDIMINPSIDQSQDLTSWWKEGGSRASTMSLSGQGQRGGAMGGGGGGEVKSLGEVKMENLGHNSDRGEYYSTTAFVTFFSKDKSLYKACPNMVDGKECNKKVSENGDGSYRCEKCAKNLDTFKWRLMLSLSLGDYSDSIWGTCFQDTAEKILGFSSEEVGQFSTDDPEKFNAVFSEACFNPFSFRMRAKADTYNDETRVKHTVVGVEKINYEEHCKRLVKEIESFGGHIPEKVDKSCYH